MCVPQEKSRNLNDINPYEGWQSARSVCVIGAGTMGSGIAAHLANLGFEVSLLDTDRDRAQVGIDKARNGRPPAFYLQEKKNDVKVGGIDQDSDFIAQADWVIEAIVENRELKRELLEKIDSVSKAQAMISTNTSGIEISLLAEGRSDSFQSRFMGVHFFNPPRYLKLIELIPTRKTDPLAVAAMTKFLEERAGRRVVRAKDTPGFIANRLGMWAMFHAVHVAEKLHLTVEQVDAITGRFIGRPKSATFRLNDIVGLDVMRDIALSLSDRCASDPMISTLALPASVRGLLERGWIGQKTGHGYYRKQGDEMLVLDLTTFAYRQQLEPALPTIERLAKAPFGERLREALDERDEVGEYLRNYLVPVLQYAHSLRSEISHSVYDIDCVMKWGFGWEYGPFETIDAIGPERVGIVSKPFYSGHGVLDAGGSYTNRREEPEYRALTEYEVVGGGETYRLRDLGDQVTAICLTTKMGVLEPKVIRELTELLTSAKLTRIVLASEARSFSAGFDLRFVQASIQSNDLTGIDASLLELQRLSELFGKVPSVAAVFGHCLGAGLEIALGCGRIAAHAECQIGLPEAKVGLIPAGRGSTLMRIHHQESAKRLAEVAVNVALGTVGLNAEHSRSLGYLRAQDVTVYHPDRLITEAKRLVLTAVPTQLPAWSTPEGPVAGMIDRSLESARQANGLTDHDLAIAAKVKVVLAKAVSYEDALFKERTEFVDLCGKALTVARIRHMLDNNKPLHN